MSEIDKQIGKRIRAARERLGLTQEDVAQALGLTPEGFGAFERGDRRIGIEYLLKLVEILQQPVNYFLNTPPPNDLSADERDFVLRLRLVDNQGIRDALSLLLDAGATEGR